MKVSTTNERPKKNLSLSDHQMVGGPKVASPNRTDRERHDYAHTAQEHSKKAYQGQHTTAPYSMADMNKNLNQVQAMHKPEYCVGGVLEKLTHGIQMVKGGKI